MHKLHSFSTGFDPKSEELNMAKVGLSRIFIFIGSLRNFTRMSRDVLTHLKQKSEKLIFFVILWKRRVQNILTMINFVKDFHFGARKVFKSPLLRKEIHERSFLIIIKKKIL